MPKWGWTSFYMFKHHLCFFFPVCLYLSLISYLVVASQFLEHLSVKAESRCLTIQYYVIYFVNQTFLASVFGSLFGWASMSFWYIPSFCVMDTFLFCLFVCSVLFVCLFLFWLFLVGFFGCTGVPSLSYIFPVPTTEPRNPFLRIIEFF